MLATYNEKEIITKDYYVQTTWATQRDFINLKTATTKKYSENIQFMSPSRKKRKEIT